MSKVAEALAQFEADQDFDALTAFVKGFAFKVPVAAKSWSEVEDKVFPAEDSLEELEAAEMAGVLDGEQVDALMKAAGAGE